MDSNILNMVFFHLDASVTTLLQFSVLPILKILVLCSFGLVLASRRINVIPAASRKLLSKVKFLIMYIFLPKFSLNFMLKAFIILHGVFDWYFDPGNYLSSGVCLNKATSDLLDFI